MLLLAAIQISRFSFFFNDYIVVNVDVSVFADDDVFADIDVDVFVDRTDL